MKIFNVKKVSSTIKKYCPKLHLKQQNCDLFSSTSVSALMQTYSVTRDLKYQFTININTDCNNEKIKHAHDSAQITGCFNYPIETPDNFQIVFFTL